jgi:hypothetical protein
MIDLDKLEALARAATPGPWEVQVDERPHHRGGAHIERRIRTSWEHGQLKAPYPVITTSVGIGAAAGGPAHYMVSLGEHDAAHIAAANPAAVLDLIALARQADCAETVAIPVVTGEQLVQAFPFAGESNYPEFDGFTPHSVQQPTPLAIHGQAGDIFDLIREWAHLPENKRGNVGRRIIKHLNRTYAAGVRDTRTQLAVAGDAKITPLVLEQAAQVCDQQADGTNGPYRTACLQCANALRALRDTLRQSNNIGPTSSERDLIVARAIRDAMFNGWNPCREDSDLRGVLAALDKRGA